MFPPYLPPSLFQSNLTILEQITIEDFQDGSHLGYRNKMILSILNLHVAPIPPTKLWLNSTYHMGADVVWIFSRSPWYGGHCGYRNRTILAILLLRCLPSSFSSIQLMVWKMSFEDFQNGGHGSHLGYRCWTILAILNLHVSPMPPTKFQLNQLTVRKHMSLEDFQDGGHGSYLGYRNGMILAILNLHVTPMPPTKFWLNMTYHSGSHFGYQTRTV